MKRNGLFLILSSLILMGLLLTACTPLEEKPRDQGIQMDSWKYAMVTVGQGAEISVAENVIIKSMDGKVISSEDVLPGQTILIENPDDEKLAVFAVIQGDESTTLVRLVKPGHNKCPDWAGNLFSGGCEYAELPITGDR